MSKRIFTVSKKQMTFNNSWLSFVIKDAKTNIHTMGLQEPIVYYRQDLVAIVGRKDLVFHRIIILKGGERIFEKEVMFKKDLEELNSSKFSGRRPIYIVRQILNDLKL